MTTLHLPKKWQNYGIVTRVMILHDTSSLIQKIRNRDAFNNETDKTTIISVIEFPKIVSKDIGILYPRAITCNLAVNLARKLLHNGTPVKSPDIIIAAIAIEKQIPVRTGDKHFSLIQQVEPKLNLENVPKQ